MINLKLTKFESDLLQMFFNLCPQWKQVITQQIQQSTLQRERSISNYSVYFRNDVKVDRLNIATKMPVEIILGNVDIPAENMINHINGCAIVSPFIRFGQRCYWSQSVF